MNGTTLRRVTISHRQWNSHKWPEIRHPLLIPTTETTRKVQCQSLFKVQNMYMCWILRPLTRRNPGTPDADAKPSSIFTALLCGAAFRNDIFLYRGAWSQITFIMIYWTTSPFRIWKTKSCKVFSKMGNCLNPAILLVILCSSDRASLISK